MTPVVSHWVIEAARAQRRRRLLVITCLAVAAILLAGSYGLVRVTVLPERQARSAVSSYFEALADQDQQAVERVVAPEALAGIPLVGGAAGLRLPAVLRQLYTQGYQPPEAAEIVEVTIGGRQAIVRVEYGFASTTDRYEAALRLRRDGGVAGTALARWRILDAFGTLQLGAVAPGAPLNCDRQPFTGCVTINGLDVRRIAGRLSGSPIMLPGRHRVEIITYDPLTGHDRQSVVVLVPPGGTGPID